MEISIEDVLVKNELRYLYQSPIRILTLWYRLEREGRTVQDPERAEQYHLKDSLVQAILEMKRYIAFFLCSLLVNGNIPFKHCSPLPLMSLLY